MAAPALPPEARSGPGGPGRPRRDAPPSLLRRHSPEFVAAWRTIYCGVYRWRSEGGWAVVPSLLGRPTYSYVPGLNSSDLDPDEAEALAREVEGRAHNIRVLGAPVTGDPPSGSPVAQRLDLSAWGRDSGAIWTRALAPQPRRSIRRAREAGYTVSEEAGASAVGIFHGLARRAFERHGSPMVPARLFSALVSDLGARILVVREAGGGRPAASLIWLRDRSLAWAPWSGALRRRDHPGSLLFWGWVERALADGVEVLDFGRSSAGQGAYVFKRSFGATAIPLRWFSDRSTHIYRRYAAAQRFWRALPRPVTRRVGPVLCRYLADY